MKTSVLVILIILAGCAQAPIDKNAKGGGHSAQKEKAYVGKLDRLQEERDREKLLGKKNQLEGGNRFRAVPQHKRLDLQLSSETDLYDQGLQSLTARHYGESLLYFNRVIEKYPGTFSARSAMFQKAILYRKMNLNEESRRALLTLKNKYPGTLEAKRADIVLKTAN